MVEEVGDGALSCCCVLEGKAQIGQDCEAAVLDLLGLHTVADMSGVTYQEISTYQRTRLYVVRIMLVALTTIPFPSKWNRPCNLKSQGCMQIRQ